jgi:DNA polymerase III subunit beta
MKLSLSTAELLTQLQTVTRVASTRSAVQALSGVMISASDSATELLATDMEVGLRVPLQATVTRPGQAVLPARLLLDVVRALPAAEASSSTCARSARRTSRRCRPPPTRPV